LENNSVDFLGIKSPIEYNLSMDILCKNVAEIAPAKLTMVSKAVPNTKTQNGILPKKQMLFVEDNYKQTKKRKLVNGQVCEKALPTLPNPGTSAAKLKDKVRIRRPPNAFIVFANEWRKNIAAQNPQEKNKQISTRLGAMWKLMSKEQKEHYTQMAHKLELEHKEKYPDYVYCPKEARLKKALRAEARDLKISANVKSNKTNTAINGTRSRHRASKQQQVDMKIFYESFYPEVVATEVCTRPNPVPSRMLPKQERDIEETKVFQGQVRQNKLQGCTDRYLNIGNNAYQQSASRMNVTRKRDCVVMRKIVGQRRLPYIQMPQSGAVYITIPSNEIKIQEGDLLDHVTEVHQQKVLSYPVKQQRVNGSYESCMKTKAIAGTQGSSDPDAAGQTVTHTGSAQQHLYLCKYLVGDPLLSQNSITTAEEMDIQTLITTSLENCVNQLPQRLLEDYADFIDKLLLQSDFNNEILAFKSVLELDNF
jgi:hypothetical protein